MVSSITLATTGTPVVFIDKPPGCGVVGTDPWGDASDDTWTLGQPKSNITGTLANLTDSRTPTDVVLRSRVQVSVGGSYSLANLMVQDFDSGEQIAFFANGVVLADGAIHDTEFRVSADDPGNLAYYIGWLRDAALTIVHAYSGTAGSTMTVYAATVTVEFAGHKTPLRRHPHPGAAATPRRHWPASPTNRHVGGIR
jgi:hypothetical protein